MAELLEHHRVEPETGFEFWSTREFFLIELASHYSVLLLKSLMFFSAYRPSMTYNNPVAYALHVFSLFSVYTIKRSNPNLSVFYLPLETSPPGDVH